MCGLWRERERIVEDERMAAVGHFMGDRIFD
jgi:hypothetical protein